MRTLILLAVLPLVQSCSGIQAVPDAPPRVIQVAPARLPEVPSWVLAPVQADFVRRAVEFFQPEPLNGSLGKPLGPIPR